MKSHDEKPQIAVVIFSSSVLASLLLGAWGFWEVERDWHFPNLFYKSIQLFGLESGSVDGPVPWQLEIARWLAPLTLAGGLFELIKALLGRRIDLWKARRLRGHHLVCGLGDKGLALAEDLLADGEKVVAMDLSPSSDNLARFRRLGGLHLPIKVTVAQDLDSAVIHRAATFTALTPDDSCNLALALAMETADAKTDPDNKLRIFAHIGNVAFRDLLDRNGFLCATPHGPSMVRSFNSHANLSRLLFREFPFETAGHTDGAVNTVREIHVILPELGASATAMLIHAGRTGHYLGDRKIHFHVVASNASDSVKGFLSGYPSFARCCASLNTVDISGQWETGRAVRRILHDNPHACITVFACFDTDPGHLATVLQIQELAPAGIPFRMPLPNGLRYLLEPVMTRDPLLRSRIAWFPETRTCTGREAVFNERLDHAARTIHEAWHAETGRQMRDAETTGDRSRADALRNKPIYKPWECLAESQKDASRSQADHLEVKIRAAGLGPSNLSSKAWSDWCASHPDCVDLLARVEHERWAARLWLSGWTLGTTRDDTRKLHDNLVPYEDLDESTKEFDRDAVRGIGRYLVGG
jgi:hypothetical protein